MKISGEASRDGRDLLFWIRVAGTGLSLSLFVWLISRSGWLDLIALFSEIPIRFFLIAIGLIFSRYVFQTLRWSTLLRAQDVPLRFRSGLRLVLTGVFASNFLPTVVGGDIVRLLGISQSHGRIAVGAASLVADRTIGVLSMLPFLPLGASLVRGMDIQGFLGMGVFALLPERVRGEIEKGFRKLRDTVGQWISKPWSVALAFVFSTLAVVVQMAAIWLLAWGIGIHISFFEVAGISALIYFITLVPISINGYGVREIGIVALYTQMGASTPRASALALLSRLAMICVSLPGALWLPGTLVQRDRSGDN